MSSVDADRELFETVIDAVRKRLPRNQRLRRNLPDGGRLRIDRQLPFLCVYRIPEGRQDAGTRELVTTEAAYLVASANPRQSAKLRLLCETIQRQMLEHFGQFLFLEIWSLSAPRPEEFRLEPRFQIVTDDADVLPTTISALHDSLKEIQLGLSSARVETITTKPVAPPGLSSLCETSADSPGISFALGLAVEPVYQHPESGRLYPLVLQQLRRQLAQAIRQGVSAFAGRGDTIPHYHTYGPTSMVRAAREVDQQLGEVAEKFDFLLQVTPVNADQAWLEFQADECRHAPTWYYRPLPYDPVLLKRELFEIPIERIEDPTLAWLFFEKQTELDRQLSSLRDLDTPEFVQSSLQLYGGVEPELLALALQILERISPESPSDESSRIGATDVVRGARDEIDYYRVRSPVFNASVELSDTIAAGVMVSRDRLLVSRSLTIRPERLTSLLHHEVGTHLLTYFNGRTQPFRQLATGLAGYESLQEGLAVLAEYLSGGLTRSRLRTLAGRVIAVHSMLQGADFLQTFLLLRETHGFSARTAYTTSLRAHRGGGLTKDVAYLRGLRSVFNYLRKGHEIEPLYVGKIALSHIPFIQELRRRDIIRAPTLLPRVWNDEDLRERVAACRSRDIANLLELRT